MHSESGDPRFAGEMKLTWKLNPAPEGVPVVIIAENVPDGITRDDAVDATSTRRV